MQLAHGLSREQFRLSELMSKKPPKQPFGLGRDFNIKECRRECIEAVIVSRECMNHPAAHGIAIAR
jgi:hypothetical protein